MADQDFNIEAYLKRIGYNGSLEPCLDTLNKIVNAHARTIPFENLDVFLGRPIHLDANALQKKLIQNKRGGYCFEQNRLLILALKALNFKVVPLSGRIRNGCERSFVPPRTHLFARVEIDDVSWFSDVGIGGLSLTSALKFSLNETQGTPHEARRIIQEDGTYFHQALLGKAWHDVCDFTLEEMPLIDQNVANWYTSTHPESFFKNCIRLAKPCSNGTRIAIKDTVFIKRNAKGEAEKHTIASTDEFVQIISEDFHIDLDSESIENLSKKKYSPNCRIEHPPHHQSVSIDF